ncbi:MAG: AcrR family transcriptional regulator [Lysobacterales bacterium]
MSNTAEKYQSHRQDAIRSAAAVFAEKGYHGSSTGDIAEHLGIKQGSLYYYFKSKEEALLEVCLYAVHDYAGQMDTIAATDQPFEAKLLAAITAHLSKFREQNAAIKVYHFERLYLPEVKRKKLYEIGSGYRQQLEGIFAQGISSGAVRESTDCRFAAQAVIGMCNAWGELIVRDPDMDLFDVIQKCTDLLSNGFINK